MDTGGQCASLVGGMPGTKGKLKEEQKWSNWIRQLVNGSNETYCNDLDRPKMAELRRLVVQASAKLREARLCAMPAEGRGRDSPRVLGQQVGQGGGLGLGERRIGVFPIASGVVDWDGGDGW